MELVLQKKTLYLPVPLTLVPKAEVVAAAPAFSFSSSGDEKQQTEITKPVFQHDVLFYGSLCARRSRILDKLQEDKHKLKIKVVSGVYGKGMAEMIQASRVVLNLHYYEKALLETTRINEVLQYDRIVVSEDPVAEDKYSRSLYKHSVIFTRNLDEYTGNGGDGDDDRHIEELAMTLRFYSDHRISKSTSRNVSLLWMLSSDIALAGLSRL